MQEEYEKQDEQDFSATLEDIPQEEKDRLEKVWQNLRITSDFIFCYLLTIKPICIRIIEALLNIKVKDIVYITTQKSIKASLYSKGIRFDVHVLGSDKIFCIEMQVRNEGDLPYRMRAYVSRADTDSIKEGQGYKEMKEIYVIFICSFDFFRLGFPRYSLQLTAKEDPNLVVEDGIHRYLFNAKASLEKMKEELSEDAYAFMTLVANRGVVEDNALVRDIQREINIIKQNKNFMGEYMLANFEKNSFARQHFDQGIKKGIQKGEQNKALEIAKNALHMFDDKVIEQLTQLPLETIKNLRKNTLYQ